MKASLEAKCRLFIENRNLIRSGFGWESTYMYPLCAEIVTSKNQTADMDKMERCKRLLKQETGAFSNFRGMTRLVTITRLSMEEFPEDSLRRTLLIYDKLKGVFFTSTYLPMVAQVIAELAKEEEYDSIVERTRRIYDLMKKKHPFLTSGEDSTFAALLALAGLEEEAAVEETERCYEILKREFYSGNSVQSLSHVLTLGEGNAEDKCTRTVELYQELKSRGHRYGRNQELPTLGVLSMMDQDLGELAGTICEVDGYLKHQKGFGLFGVGEKQRLMYAGMLTMSDCVDELSGMSLSMAAVNGAISLIVAQQTAICAATAASAAAASSSGSSD